jgi:hypothetical protein
MAKKKRTGAVIPLERITHSIILIRGQKVMLDIDLARLYGVETKTLNRAIRATSTDFPKISCFSLQPRNMPT